MPTSSLYDVQPARTNEGPCWLICNSCTNTLVAISFESGHADMVALALNYLNNEIGKSSRTEVSRQVVSRQGRSRQGGRA